MVSKKVAVIGGGVAGLCSAKHALQNGFEVTLYEQTTQIGGIWVYTDKIGDDDYGLKVHTSMYQGLNTNLPKEVMGFPDYEYPESGKSYLPASEVLEFIESYAEKFKLRDVIKFRHHVIRIRPLENSQWEVIVKDLVRDVVETFIYDAVMVCNGHYHTPNLPHLEGENVFKGEQLHSHDYRCPEPFEGKDVLIIGAGPSGMDLVHGISKTARRVTFSLHQKQIEQFNSQNSENRVFLDNVSLQGNVKRLTEDGAEFVDGTHEKFSVIFYCTGYKYTFPFLSADCGIYVDDNFVQPLYKHCVNINYPTMALIGLPFYVCTTQMFDIQVRFFMKFLTGGKAFPSKEEMIEDTNKEMERRWNKGYKKRQAHIMGPEQKNYFQQLAETAEIENVKDVMTEMHNDSRAHLIRDPINFRKDVYKIIDDKTFTKYMIK